MQALQLLISTVINSIMGVCALVPDTVLLAPFIFFLAINIVATLKLIVKT